MESEVDSEITGTDYSLSADSSDSDISVSPTHSRKRQRMTLRQNYTSGTSRNAYRFSKNLELHCLQLMITLKLNYQGFALCVLMDYRQWLKDSIN